MSNHDLNSDYLVMGYMVRYFTLKLSVRFAER